MSVDRSANRRFELETQIASVERQMDELFDLRNRYQRSLESFREQFHSVVQRREVSLQEKLSSASGTAQQEATAKRAQLFRVDRYVENSTAELEWTSSRARESLDDERQTLTRERNNLPWE